MEKKVFGYAGTVLFINLSNNKITKKKLDLNLAREYIGGCGLSARFFYDLFLEKLDPFSPYNKLIFMTGPLTGTPVPFTGRIGASALSPLTGIWGESKAGSLLGPELKFAGYDGIIIYGKSKKPVYLLIDDDNVEIKDASDVWGLLTSKTIEFLHKEIGRGFRIATIGPAGENLVKFSAIVHELGAIMGRCGLGAVMGSKKLKAIAVMGSRSLSVAKPKELQQTIEKMIEKIREKYERLAGLPYFIDFERWEKFRDTPIKNWRDSVWEDLSGEEKVLATFACPSCPIGCVIKRATIIKGLLGDICGNFKMETRSSFGPLILNKNLETVAHAGLLCNEYGLDTISTGEVIAFAMECYENNLLRKEDLGFTLEWGDKDVITELIKIISIRKGAGGILSEGVKRAAEIIGGESKKYAMHVKGLEIPMHDPRPTPQLAIVYALSCVGANHCKGTVRVAEKFFGDTLTIIEKTLHGMYISEVLDSLLVCRFGAGLGEYMDEEDLSTLLSLVTGLNTNTSALIEIGRRILTLKRMINIRRGISKVDDDLPERFKEHPKIVKEGPMVINNFRDLLGTAYNLLGWSENGIPKEEILRELNLLEIVEKHKKG
ncbi:MAG: aldehyde ferredoxin oxidoreductase family protein [Candidatus Bathyarchaeia archaeon]